MSVLHEATKAMKAKPKLLTVHLHAVVYAVWLPLCGNTHTRPASSEITFLLLAVQVQTHSPQHFKFIYELNKLHTNFTVYKSVRTHTCYKMHVCVYVSS